MCAAKARLDVTIRPVTASDRPVWAALWRLYLTFYKTELSEATYDITWSRFMDPNETMHAALAQTKEGRVVGLVHYIEHRTCWTPKNSIYLQDLFVDESVRGHGVGCALIQHVYDEANKRGVGKVHWLTHEANKDAQALYEKVAERSGFIQYRKNL